MSQFERIFAVTRACCKADGADVPEVEAVIRLILPRVRAAYTVILDSISDRAEALLRQDHDLSDGVDALLAAYVTAATRLATRPLAREAVKLIEQAAGSLARTAAEHGGLPLPANLAASASLAAEQVQLMLEGLIEFAVERSLPTATRLALAGRTGPGSSESAETFRAELEDALDVERALLPLVDAWAYQTFNAGSVRAAAADGHNFVQLQARIDEATTAFCRLVNGRVVPMARALDQLARIEAAVTSGDVAALEGAAPFISNPREATEADVDAAIERGGLAPFHHGCRTRNVPIRIEAP